MRDRVIFFAVVLPTAAPLITCLVAAGAACLL